MAVFVLVQGHITIIANLYISKIIFPFRKQAMPLLTVDAIIGNQAFQNGRCYICSSLGLDKVKTDFN